MVVEVGAALLRVRERGERLDLLVDGDRVGLLALGLGVAVVGRLPLELHELDLPPVELEAAVEELLDGEGDRRQLLRALARSALEVGDRDSDLVSGDALPRRATVIAALPEGDARR